MKTENVFIAPDIIRLRDGIKKLSGLLEARPKPPANPTPEQCRLLESFHEFQTRMGAGIFIYEMEIDKMLKDL